MFSAVDAAGDLAVVFQKTVNIFQQRDLTICGDPDIAVYARHQLFKELPETVEQINAEEDLGLEGLRKLKQGMRPVELLNMFEGVSLCEGTVQSI